MTQIKNVKKPVVKNAKCFHLYEKMNMNLCLILNMDLVLTIS